MKYPTKRLEDIAEVRAGSPAPQGSEYFSPDGFPFVRVQDVGRYGRTTSLSETKDRINIHAVKTFRPAFAKKGTIVFPKSGAAINTNSRAILGVDAYVVSHLAMLNAREEIVENLWLYYFLCTVDMGAFARTAALPSLRLSELKVLPVPVPPLTEQRRIVARIKECMERIDEIEKLRLQSLSEREILLESLVEAMVGSVKGVSVLLNDVCQINSKLVDPRELQYLNHYHVGGANIESRTGRLIDLKTSQEEGLKSGKFIFDATMVLYNKIRPYLVKVALPSFQGLCSADMYPLSPDASRLSRDYLFFVLMSRHFTNYAIAGSNRAGMPKVNRKHLFAYRFNLPKLTDQAKTTDILNETRSIVEQLQTEMAAGHNENASLRESILRKAFAGEL